MWAKVKFTSDGQVLDVPISFFENGTEIQEELQSGKVRNEYQVFYSSDPKDTPEKVLKSQGRILKMDEVKQIGSKRQKGRCANKGYYKATLERWAESENELQDREADYQDDEGVGSKRLRVKPPAANFQPKTQKLLSKAQQKRLKESARQSNLHLTDKKELGYVGILNPEGDSEKKTLEVTESKDKRNSHSMTDVPLEACAVVEGTSSSNFNPKNQDILKLNLQQQENNLKRRFESSTFKKVPASVVSESEDDGSDDDVPLVEYRDLRAKLRTLEQDYEKCQKQLMFKDQEVKDLMLRNAELQKLNILWQEKELKRSGSSSKSHRKYDNKDSESRSQTSRKKETDTEPKRNSSQNIGSRLQLFSSDTCRKKVTEQTSKSYSQEVKEGPLYDFKYLDEDQSGRQNDLNLSDNIDEEISNDILQDNEDNSKDKTIMNKSTVPPNSYLASETHTSPAGIKLKEGPSSVPNSTVITNKKGKRIGGVELAETSFHVSPPEGVYNITYQQFMNICKTTKAGEEGDSVFVKNCASLLWNALDLANRSVTGVATVNKPGSVALAEATPKKKEYLRELLTLRINSQIDPVSEEEFQRRNSNTKFKEYLRSKIKTVQRELRGKGLFV